MKKFYILLILAASSISAQTLTFADPQFKAYLLTSNASNNIAIDAAFNSIKIDADSDGQIQASEAAQVVRLFVQDAGVTGLGGVEGFANLGELDVKQSGVGSVTLASMPNLVNLSFQQNASLTYLNVSGAPGLIQLSATDNPQLSSMIMLGCTNIGTVVGQNNALTTLDFNGFTNLLNVYLDNNQLTSINLTGCTNLNGITGKNNLLTQIIVDGLTNLVSMDFSDNPNLSIIHAAGCSALNGNTSTFFAGDNNITYADFSGCTSLDSVDTMNNAMATLNVTGCSSLVSLNCGYNNLTSLSLTGCDALQYLNCANGQLQTLNLGNVASLVDVEAYANHISGITGAGQNITTLNLSGNMLANVDFSNHTTLTSLNLAGNPLVSINLSGCTALASAGFAFDTVSDTLQHIDISGCASFSALQFNSSAIQSVNVQGCTNLLTLGIDGLGTGTATLSNLDVSNLPALSSLSARYVALGTINVSGSAALQTIYLDHNNLTGIDLSGNPDVITLDLQNNLLTSLDLSNQSHLQNVYLNQNFPLASVIAKNGSAETFTFDNFNMNLAFVCQDDFAVAATQLALNNAGLSAVCNSYCSFTPGGDHNTITGTIRYDLDANGCDLTDPVRPYVRVNINDGTDSGATFSQADGHYVFYTGAGSFSLTPDTENPSIFNITPATATIPFADGNGNAAAQDFCISANGVHNDIEIVIAPIHPARPGFVAIYQLTVRNKGNQTQSGTFNVAFDDAVMDFASATLPPDSQTTGMLNWNYSGLQPFETRSFYVIMNVNSPTQTPPVNIGDVLTLIATINPIAGDINPLDNQFVLHQEVVGSYDPNSIACLEGASLPTSEIGNYLHYIANFENTGSAVAENVVVRIDIDPAQYDVESLQLLATSDPAYTRITGNRAEFIFENINLAATAGNPPVGGHGNVLFKIKSSDALAQGDHVAKQASIYFDYNAPVQTLPADTVFNSLKNPGFTPDDSVSIFPNPAADVVHIKAVSDIDSVELFDAQGRILEQHAPMATDFALDISARATGIYFLRIKTSGGGKVEKIVKP